MNFKILTQVLVPIVIVIALVGGVTFVTHYQRAPTASATTTNTGPDVTPSPADFPLYFPTRIVEWNPTWEGEFETRLDGHYDFWFENQKPSRVKLGVMSKNCKCSRVDVCVLDEKDMEKVRTWRSKRTIELVAEPARSPEDKTPASSPDDESLLKETGVRLKWEPLVMDDSRSKWKDIEAGKGGLLRFGWEKKDKIGPERLSAEIWAQVLEPRPGSIFTERLELPITLVGAVSTYPGEANLGDIPPGGETETKFTCWSSTRPAFTLSAQVLDKNDVPDPCFSCTITPLTPGEQKAVSDELGVRVRSGYRVAVKGRERLNEKIQIDLGPFRRKLALKSDVSPESATATLVGTVRGVIAVGTEADKDRVLLKDFLADRGVVRTLEITSDQANLELDTKDVEVEPEWIIAKLKKLSPPSAQRWELRVEVPPNRHQGPMPVGSAVYLKIVGDSRRVRIPVNGNAFQR